MKKRMYLLIGAFLFQIIKLFSLKKQKRIIQRLRSKIQGLQIMSSSDLKNKVKNGIHKIGDYVLCSGTLHNPQKLYTIIEPKKSIVYSSLELQKIFQFGQRINSFTKRIQQLHPSYIKLLDGSKDTFINIYQTLQTKFLPFNYKQKIKQNRQQFFNIGSILQMFTRIPNRIIETKFTEKYIPQNTEAIVFGKIQQAKSINSKPETIQLFIKSPKYVAHSKSQLLEYLQQEILTKKFQIFCFFFLIGFTTYVVVKKIVLPLIQNYINLKKDKDTKLNQVQIKKRMCEVCKNSLNNIVSLPCRHMGICQNCYESERITEQNIICRICQKKGSQIFKVFPC